ncbi:MAG: N-acetylneuraminate lyase [Pirellulaceae bacterium]|nr:MAG: N-acetylneuraminate lyase [Pirellulaceae bacterium]
MSNDEPMTETCPSFFPYGLVPAVPTPFDASGALRLDFIERQAMSLAELGVRTVFVAGTTGECQSLSVEERERLVERWCDVARGAPLHVWAHVGHTVQEAACRLARSARRCGAAAVAATAPFYHRPRTVEDLVSFLQPIAENADLPFYYYDIPHVTHVVFPLKCVIEEALKRLPRFAGVKYTNSDLIEFQRCVSFFGDRLAWMHGFDETLAAGILLGATGAVGSTYNVAYRFYRRIVNELEQGRWQQAARLQRQSVALVDLLDRHGLVPALKAVLDQMGVPCGPPRPPLRPVPPETARQLYQQLQESGLLDKAEAFGGDGSLG